MRAPLILFLFVAAVLGVVVFQTQSSVTDPEAHSQEEEVAAGDGDQEAAALESDGLAGEVADSNRSEVAEVEAQPEWARGWVPPVIIHGRLVDELGRVMSGVDIQCDTQDSVMGRGMLAAVADALGNGHRAVFAKTRTDEHGLFRFEHKKGLEPGLHLRVSARVPAYAPFNYEFVHSGDMLIDLGDLVLDRGVQLAGRVVDSDGVGIEGAVVKRLVDDGPGVLNIGQPRGEEVCVSGPEGAFEIQSQAVGPWSFRVEAEGFQRADFEGETLRVDERLHDLEWTLPLAASIRGQLVGKPAESGELRAELWPDNGGGAIQIGGGMEFQRSKIDTQGQFSFDGLEPGASYRVQVIRPGSGPLTGSEPVTNAVVATAGGEDVRLEWHEGARVEMRVVDAVTGEAVERLGVRMGFSIPTPNQEAGVPRKFYEGGHVVLAGLRPEGENDDLFIHLSAPGYEVKSVTQPMRPTDRVNLGQVALIPAPRLDVTVTDPDGQPVEGAAVTLEEVEHNPGMRVRIMTSAGEVSARHDYTDENGRVRLSSLPGVESTLTVRAADYAPHSESVTLPDGATEYEVRLAPGGSVLVRSFDANGDLAPRQPIEHTRPVGDAGGIPPVPVLTDSEGVHEFTGLEAGMHYFRIIERDAGMGARSFSMSGNGGRPDGDGWQEVAVEPGGQAELDLQREARGGLSGQITAGGTPLAGAKLVLERKGAMFNGAMPGEGPTVLTSSNGDYRFTDIRAGEFELVISHKSRDLASRFDVELEAGEGEFDADLPVNSVSGRIVDGEGKPLAGVRVQAEVANPGQAGMMIMFTSSGSGPGVMSISTGEEPDPVITDEDGRYTLQGLPEDELVLEATLGGYQPAQGDPFEVGPGEEKDLADITLVPGGTLVVSIDLPNAPGQLLVMASLVGGPRGAPQVAQYLGEDLRFEDLAVGEWSVRVQLLGPGSGEWEAPEPMTINVVAGEEALAEFRP